MNTENALKTSMKELYNAIRASDASAVKAADDKVYEALHDHCNFLYDELVNTLGWGPLIEDEEYREVADKCRTLHWEYVEAMHKAIELTQYVTKERFKDAAKCACILIDNFFDSMYETVYPYLVDSDDGDNWLFTFPSGPPLLALLGYLAQFHMGGQCFVDFFYAKYEKMWLTIAKVQDDEPMHRVLKRCVLTFAGIHKYACVDERLHEMAENMVDDSREEDDPQEELLAVIEFMPKEPVFRDTFLRMYHARKAYKIVAPDADKKDVDALTMQVARQCIDEEKKRFDEQVARQCMDKEKKRFYKGLWRKFWLVWVPTSRLWKMLGERLGGPSGPFGAAAIDAYDADMGDSARPL